VIHLLHDLYPQLVTMGQVFSAHATPPSTKVGRTSQSSAHHRPPRQKPQRSHHINTAAGARSKNEGKAIFERKHRSKDVPTKLSRIGHYRIRAEEELIRLRPTSRQHKHHHQPESEVNEEKECVVCADTRPLHKFPSRLPTTACKHGIDVCRKCLRTWIASEFDSKTWDEINCPICPARMLYRDMWEFAPKDVVKRYVSSFRHFTSFQGH
jgi:hypothetical protein